MNHEKALNLELPQAGSGVVFLPEEYCDIFSAETEDGEASSGTVENTPQYSLGKNTAPEPAWGNSKLSAYS